MTTRPSPYGYTKVKADIDPAVDSAFLSTKGMQVKTIQCSSSG